MATLANIQVIRQNLFSHTIVTVIDACTVKKIVSEYDQEIPQSQTVDNLWHREEEPLNHHDTPGRQNMQSNQLSLPHQDDCNTRTDIK